MIFNFHTFIAELSNLDDKKDLINKFESFYPGILELPLENQIWYVNYIQYFETIDYKNPEELSKDFDWSLLMKLVAGSFSNLGKIDMETEDGIPELIVTVTTKDQAVTKKISDLWGFQILRLFEIYIEEQMRLQVLIGEKEKNAILLQKKSKLKRWSSIIKGNSENNNEIDLHIENEVFSSLDYPENEGLFNFHKFINELKKIEEKKELINKYEEYFPNMLSLPLEKQIWYIEYVTFFANAPSFRIPYEIREEFNWNLLLQLLASSFSSSISFGKKTKKTTELRIDVGIDTNTVRKTLSDLRGFQVLRLFEIYVEENMNLQVYIVENENNIAREAIKSIRRNKKLNWRKLVSNNAIKELTWD